MQKKTGVSLIVLVITVIVMVILAGTIILTVNNTGIMERGESAVSQYNLNEITNIANVAWGEAYINGARTEQELKDAVLDSLTKAKITPDKYKGYELNVTLSGVTLDAVEPNVIPEGGRYYVGVTSVTTGDYTGATATYTAGDEFPTLKEGDVYVYGDYEYRYNYQRAYDHNASTRDFWEKIEGIEGWGVHVLNNAQDEYGLMLESVNGADIVSLKYTFKEISPESDIDDMDKIVQLAQNFRIPKGAIDISYMFSESKIETLPDGFAIPEGVRNAQEMFYYCTNLRELPENFTIPKGVTDVSGMFSVCESLERLPNNFTIPEGVTDVSTMFGMCYALSTWPNNLKLPTTIESTRSMFFETDVSNLPVDFLSEGIKDISYMFVNCYGVIPKQVLVTQH